MRNVIEEIDKKIELNKIGEWTDWKDGYKTGLEKAKKIIEECISDFLTIGGVYYVIMYHYGDRYHPYVEKMKLYRISGEKRIKYLFSRNLNATTANTTEADLILGQGRVLSRRVFLTELDAKRAIKK